MGEIELNDKVLYNFRIMKNKVQQRYQSAEPDLESNRNKLLTSQIRNSFDLLNSSLSELIIEEREMGRSQ